MIAEIVTVMQDEPLLADELRIIAGEARLSSKDRESLRKSAVLLNEALESYARVFFRLRETEARLTAIEERLREANRGLQRSNVFPTISAKTTVIGAVNGQIS